MGVVNVTPDSFYPLSRRRGLSEAVETALAMEAAGAAIVDLGGESTRPGSDYVPEDEELERVVPTIAEIRARSALIISVDTRKAAVARAAYAEAAKALGAKRRAAALLLDEAVARELPPLKLERARFVTRLDALDEGEWGAAGTDRVAFQIATNPGAPPGPLNKIASGGELARFMLALKVVLARTGSVPTLIFDEVDAGIGGAVAAAVGERLERLGREVQVLVVTHSPQVAARGAGHFQVRKHVKGETVATDVVELDGAARQEEIARMLSGAHITPEARAAAAALIKGAPA